MRQDNAPGKLGNSHLTLATDPRTDARIAAMAAMMDGFAPGLKTLAANASYDEARDYCMAFEQAAAQVHAAAWAAMPDYSHIEQRTEIIAGSDGHDIKLYIHRPADSTGPLPCVYHTHGGGMVVMQASDPGFVRFRNDLAAQGLVVVGVEFRNGGGALGAHPFPAGLNDCTQGLEWVHGHAAELGISRIVIAGESGGGNLAIATSLKAKQEGWLDRIQGIYAMCPYISGQYAHPPQSLPSLRENDGYMLECQQMAGMVTVYDPTGEHADNPLAWPLCADQALLSDLPPCVISVNELDPLRDEGLQFYRQLLAAGVTAVGRMALGTPHAGDQAFPDVTPDIYADLLASIRQFAYRL